MNFAQEMQQAADQAVAKDTLRQAFEQWQADPTEENDRVVQERCDVLASVTGVDQADSLQPIDWQNDDAASLIADVRSRMDRGPILPVRMSEIGELAERAWLVDQWLPRGRIGMLTAEGGFGKSRLALQLAAAMTTGGGEWLPRGLNKSMPETAAGVVVFATWEDEPEECRRRIGRERACRGIHGAGLEVGNPPAGKFDPDCPACADFAHKWLIDLTPGAGHVIAAAGSTGREQCRAGV